MSETSSPDATTLAPVATEAATEEGTNGSYTEKIKESIKSIKNALDIGKKKEEDTTSQGTNPVNSLHPNVSSPEKPQKELSQPYKILGYDLVALIQVIVLFGKIFTISYHLF
jgi:hypothetical protein